MANEANKAGDDARELNKPINIPQVPKEDMLDLEKTAAAMKEVGQKVSGVHGKSIGGSGAGPSTGDPSEDYERPSTDGLPAKNDYVSKEKLPDATINDVSSRASEAAERIQESNEPLEGEGQGYESPGSGFPGTGAVRTAEDRIPPGRSPEEE